MNAAGAVAAYPHYVFSGVWQIASNGVLTPKTRSDWAHGDPGQRATSLLNGWTDYYRYSRRPRSHGASPDTLRVPLARDAPSALALRSARTFRWRGPPRPAVARPAS